MGGFTHGEIWRLGTRLIQAFDNEQAPLTDTLVAIEIAPLVRDACGRMNSSLASAGEAGRVWFKERIESNDAIAEGVETYRDVLDIAKQTLKETAAKLKALEQVPPEEMADRLMGFADVIKQNSDKFIKPEVVEQKLRDASEAIDKESGEATGARAAYDSAVQEKGRILVELEPLFRRSRRMLQRKLPESRWVRRLADSALGIRDKDDPEEPEIIRAEEEQPTQE